MPAGNSSIAAAGGQPELGNEQQSALGVERGDHDRAGVDDYVALGLRAVRRATTSLSTTM